MLQDTFDRFGLFYDWLTANRLWRESVQEMARHLPPSGPTLRLIDAGGGPANSARALYTLRPDLAVVALDLSAGMLRTAQRRVEPSGAIRLLRADVRQLPFATASHDAITAHSMFYLLDAAGQAAFLAEAWRVLRPGGRLILLDPALIPFPWGVIRQAPRSAPSVLLWHWVSRSHLRATPEAMARRLETAGFGRVFGEKAVRGYGVLSRGEKMTARAAAVRHGRTPPQTTKAAVENPTPLSGQAILDLPGPYLFLLIRQTPVAPLWSLPAGTVIRWQAVSARSPDQGDWAMAFSALPKAVAFMQPAVTSGQLLGVTRIAKFDKATAARWPFPILLNPPPAFNWPPGTPLEIDPASAVTGDE